MSARIKIAELEREAQERESSILRMRLMERDARAIDAIPALLRLARAANRGHWPADDSSTSCWLCQALAAFDFEDSDG